MPVKPIDNLSKTHVSFHYKLYKNEQKNIKIVFFQVFLWKGIIGIEEIHEIGNYFSDRKIRN